MKNDMYKGYKFRENKILIDQKKIDLYAKASGDNNPIHLNEEYAQTTSYGKRIAHGMLTLGILSEILVKEFPKSWYKKGNIKVRFTAPVFPSEYIITYGEIISIIEFGEKKIAKCNIGCKKIDGTDIISGKAEIIF
tara:strand:- start:215 stop:622 length:408 start_codon:yes stop_codon:yes gene_type:complete